MANNPAGTKLGAASHLISQAGIDGIIYRVKPVRRWWIESDAVSEKFLPEADNLQCANRHHWTAVILYGWLKREKRSDISSRTLVR